MDCRQAPHVSVRLRTLVLALAACLVMSAAAPAADAKPLKRGSHGKRVERLQRALHVRPDGIFGKSTARAVRRFQRRHGLHADGIVGPATWRAIGRGRVRGTSVSRTGVRIQTRGSSVRLLQRKLGIGADGVFGPGTARAVRRAQRANGVTADGIVGPATWRAIGVRGRHPVLRRAHVRRGGGGGSGVPGAVLRAIAAANRIAGFPYRYGGGHGTFNDTGYDCSGSVSYVLHHAGRLGRPRDSGELMSYGAAGPGRYITVYANPGHVYMVIRGRRYDTSGRYEDGTRWAGTARSSSGYVARHPPGL
jgi:hypothetical protein